MSVRILFDDRGTGSIAALYCSTTDLAFGPVFSSTIEHDAEERVESFLRYLKCDPRSINEAKLMQAYENWRDQEEDQWNREAEDG